MTLSLSNSGSIKSVYLIAICGTGMTALAGMLKEKGFIVRGSDQNVYPPMSTFLAETGIPVHIGFNAKNLEPEPDLVVIGNAMSRGNPEVEAVLEKKLHYVSLPFTLKEIFIRNKYSCVVTGTHGKTTTSSLLAWVLESAGKDPGFFIGGIPENFGRGYKVGQGKHFVAEGDEYDSAFFDKGSKFLHYMPDLAIINNVEFDHADIFNSIEEIETSFRRMIRLIPRNGYLISCWDDPIAKKLSEKIYSNLVTFGTSADAEWQALNIKSNREYTQFDVNYKSRYFGGFETPLYGTHMVRNCLAVIAAGQVLGLTLDKIKDGLKTFKNVRRRLQLLGEVRGIKIYDDFAHHPTEVKSTITAIRNKYLKSRIWAIFEPRSATSKRKVFEKEFVEAFAVADQVVIAPLHAKEKVPEADRLSLENICSGLDEKNIPNYVLPPNEEMVSFLNNKLSPGDVALFMSNGDFNQIPLKLFNSYK